MPVRRTLKKTLEICRDLWAWCAETGESKLDWPKWIGNGGRIDPGVAFCPCCCYATTHGGEDTCDGHCPLDSLWPNGCRISPSPYELWLAANTSKTRKKYAAAIRDAATTELKKLEAKK